MPRNECIAAQYSLLLYGRAGTRKHKLLEKEKQGKKVCQFGKVEIPLAAVIAALKSYGQGLPQIMKTCRY